MRNAFWTLMEKSTITSGVLAIALVGTACYCAITETPVPEYITLSLGVVVGFFFSSKAKDAQVARIHRSP